VSPEEIGTSEFRRELEVADEFHPNEAALAASRLVDKADFFGVAGCLGETAANYIQVGGEIFRVDKRVVVERRATSLTTDPVPTKQLALPPPNAKPSVEDRVYQVIRSHSPDVKDLSPLTRVSTIGDSLALLELALGLEGEFGCGEITDEVLSEWQTVGDAVKCVEKMLLSQGVVKPTPPGTVPAPGHLVGARR